MIFVKLPIRRARAAAPPGGGRGSFGLVYEARNGRYEVVPVYEPVTRLVRPAV